jgi:5-aminolevulinate synthase
MARHPEVIEKMSSVASLTGVGAGGTRNIAGNSVYHLALEKELAMLH